ncbi:hypothetical protein [Rhizobium gallicum]|uniref:hypothetical protein n=1 Tax=Rhizobium gallicum TaxID=56730 RepID=UPI001EF7A6A8|nr:hypothetical protein [Rhizobium gallicum]ULJ76550.1 hypothetical protein L2W42_29770 [Rhizobium gallicum]
MDSYKDRWEGSSTVKRCGAVTSVDIAACATDLKTSWLPEGVDEEIDVEANAPSVRKWLATLLQIASSHL